MLGDKVENYVFTAGKFTRAREVLGLARNDVNINAVKRHLDEAGEAAEQFGTLQANGRWSVESFFIGPSGVGSKITSIWEDISGGRKLITVETIQVSGR